MHMAQVTIAYGMTETSPVSFQSAVDDPLERRVSTVGRVQPHIEVKIVDAEGRIVPPGMPGELLTRGYCVMQGYWNDPERTAEAIDVAGWMHTGDLATLDADGYCNIVGRIKDMIIRGGENIYPREIEEFLYRHPKIQDVQVFGVPDARYGEELCAWITLREGVTATLDEFTGVLSRADCALQNSPLRQICRGVSDDRDRQDPEICHARADDGRTQPARGQDGMTAARADRPGSRHARIPWSALRRPSVWGPTPWHWTSASRPTGTWGCGMTGSIAPAIGSSTGCAQRACVTSCARCCIGLWMRWRWRTSSRVMGTCTRVRGCRPPRWRPLPAALRRMRGCVALASFLRPRRRRTAPSVETTDLVGHAPVFPLPLGEG